jgi:hypothetical protein
VLTAVGSSVGAAVGEAVGSSVGDCSEATEYQRAELHTISRGLDSRPWARRWARLWATPWGRPSGSPWETAIAGISKTQGVDIVHGGAS